MRVQQLMTREVFTCRSNDRLNAAAQIMWDHDCGCVPIIDENSHLVGMLTDRDICMAAYTQGKLLGDISIDSAMSRKVFSCKPEDSIRSAENLMRASRIRRLPVVGDDGALVGILSLNDLAQAAACEKDLKKKAITEVEVLETLCSICQPRWTKKINKADTAA